MLTIFHCLKGVSLRVGLCFVTFFLLLSVLSVWLIGVPGSVSAQVPVQIIDIPDPNLRAAITKALNKAPEDAITRADMETLGELQATSRDITDLRGIEFAINLTQLNLWENDISDISPLSNLTNLIELYLRHNSIRDISAVANLTNLRILLLDDNSISDISAVANLTNLTRLGLFGNSISDISAVANLTNLTNLVLDGNSISDISAVANLTDLTDLYLQNNTISNIVPLIPLTRLKLLVVSGNPISDRETLAQLIAQGTVIYFAGTPAFETPGQKITDGWVWLVVPTLDADNGVDAARSGRDFLSEASGGTLTEADVAVNGATAGTPVGDRTWTSGRLAPTGSNNLGELVNTYGLGTDTGDYPVAYGVVSIESATHQDTRLYIGALPVKVYLNGTVVHLNTYGDWWNVSNYRTAVPVTLNPGENVLFIAAYRQYPWENWGAFFGFQDGTEYTVRAPAPGAGVDIPDPNLRAAIAEALGKAPTDAITRAEMETLVELEASFREITDLRGIEFAVNLRYLYLDFNGLSDISPLSSLTNLAELWIYNNNISDISAVAGLTNLERLFLHRNTITDISPLSSLTNLIALELHDNTIVDISPLSSLTNLEQLSLSRNTISDIFPLITLTNLTWLWIEKNTISDISPLSSLTNLTVVDLENNNITDISPLSTLTNLTALWIYNNNISDIFPLITLANLERLHLGNNAISDISPLSSLTNLTYLNLGNNAISDISPLSGLTNLRWLYLQSNNISDIETLERLMAQGTVVYFRHNPAFEPPGPKIEDGWVWLIVPATGVFSGSQAAGSGRDFLSEASGGAVTEADVALNGASAGTRVGESVWTAARLDATDPNNLNTIAGTDTPIPALPALGGVRLPSEILQELGDNGWTPDGLDVTEIDKRNALMPDDNLESHIRYPVAYGVVSIRSEIPQQTRVYIGAGPVKVYLNGTVVYRDTNHWYGDNYETAVPVTLNAGNNVLFIAAYRPNPGSRWGAFFGFQDGTVYTAGAPGPGPLDVNGDGQVNVLDLVQVALFYGKRGNNLPEDVNADGVINVADLVAVANGVDAADDLSFTVEQGLLLALAEAAALEAIAEAPMRVGDPHQHALSLRRTYDNVADALTDARALGTGDVRLGKWLPLLEGLLQALAELGTIPEATALLPNYPNPFNPETWLPYQLAKPAEVVLSIYTVNARLVRTLEVGHQPAGLYHSKHRAAYWDGRNTAGEKVASGLYFYTLTAGDFTATRKLSIAK